MRCCSVQQFQRADTRCDFNIARNIAYSVAPYVGAFIVRLQKPWTHIAFCGVCFQANQARDPDHKSRQVHVLRSDWPVNKTTFSKTRLPGKSSRFLLSRCSNIKACCPVLFRQYITISNAVPRPPYIKYKNKFIVLCVSAPWPRIELFGLSVGRSFPGPAGAPQGVWDLSRANPREPRLCSWAWTKWEGRIGGLFWCPERRGGSQPRPKKPRNDHIQVSLEPVVKTQWAHVTDLTAREDCTNSAVSILSKWYFALFFYWNCTDHYYVRLK